MKLELKTTEDGSHTLFVPGLDEHYHSTHGAIGESEWVYIDAGMRRSPKASIHILEVGFGTGLNAFLAMLEAERLNRNICYTSMEMFPLPADIVQKLNYAALTGPSRQELFEKLHQCPWDEPCAVTPNFTLRKMRTDATDPSNYPSGEPPDVVFFDAFAPEKQAQMWRREIFDKLFALCAEGAILTTYCAKGAVRRMLRDAGFAVERLPGPPGKREMLRGVK